MPNPGKPAGPMEPAQARFVFFALAMGIVALSGMAFYLRTMEDSPLPEIRAEGEEGTATMLIIVLCLMAVMEFGAALFMRKIFAGRLRDGLTQAQATLAEGKIPTDIFLGRMICAALALGIGLFGIGIYMFTGIGAVLGAPFFAVAIVLGLIPDLEKSKEQVEAMDRESY